MTLPTSGTGRRHAVLCVDDNAEIAAALEIKEPTVYTRLYHARRELYARLGEGVR